MTDSPLAKKATLIHSSRGLPERKTPVALPQGGDGDAILQTAIRYALRTFLVNHDLLALQAARFKEGDAHTVFVLVPELDVYMRVARTARLATGVRISAFDLLLSMGYYMDQDRQRSANKLIASLFAQKSGDADPVRLAMALTYVSALPV